MNSRPFVESIMANAETSITAANMFAEHFIARDRTAREAAAGKALLAAETAMQSKMTELTRVADPENVFGSDITKDSSWLGLSVTSNHGCVISSIAGRVKYSI